MDTTTVTKTSFSQSIQALRASAWLLVAALLAGGIVLPERAAAQTTDEQQTASARLLFKRGVEQGDSGDWTAAADSFSRALALRESVVIRFNLAHALHEVGRLVEASEHFRAVKADPEAGRDLVQESEAALADIEPRLATLTVTVKDAPKGSEVALDGTVLLPVQLGVPIPADPGGHEATLTVEDEVAVTEQVTLEEGGSGDVQLVYVPPVVEVPEVPVEPAPMETHDDTSKRRKRWIIAASAAAAVVVAGVIVGITASGGGGSGDNTPDFNPGMITW